MRRLTRLPLVGLDTVTERSVPLATAPAVSLGFKPIYDRRNFRPLILRQPIDDHTIFELPKHDFPTEPIKRW